MFIRNVLFSKIFLISAIFLLSGEGLIAESFIRSVLPQQMYKDSYFLFPGSIATEEVRYSKDGRIIIHKYQSSGFAIVEMKAFPGNRISIDESKILHEHLGCFEEGKDFITLWFCLGKYILGFRVPKQNFEKEALIKSAEKTILNYERKIMEMFSTPETCFRTYVDAVEKWDHETIIECVYDDGSKDARVGLEALKSMSNFVFFQIARYPFSFGKDKEKIDILKTELISDDTARIALDKAYKEHTAVLILSFGGYYVKYSGDQIWIHMKKFDNRWGIDIATSFKLGYERSKEEYLRTICLSNLKQIGLALRMYMQDHKGSLPDDLKKLCPNYIGSVKTFICPGDKETGEMKELKPETKISYIFVKISNPEEIKNPNDIIVAYDSSNEFHCGEGRFVLYLDGRVMWLNEVEFQKQLKKQEEFAK